MTTKQEQLIAMAEQFETKAAAPSVTGNGKLLKQQFLDTAAHLREQAKTATGQAIQAETVGDLVETIAPG